MVQEIVIDAVSQEELSPTSSNSLTVFYNLLKSSYFPNAIRPPENMVFEVLEQTLIDRGFLTRNDVEAYDRWNAVRLRREPEILGVTLDGQSLATGLLGYFYREGMENNADMQADAVIEMAQAGTRFREELLHHRAGKNGSVSHNLLLDAANRTPDRKWARWDVLENLDSSFGAFLSVLRADAVSQRPIDYDSFRGETIGMMFGRKDRPETPHTKNVRSTEKIIEDYVRKGTLESVRGIEQARLLEGLRFLRNIGWVGHPVFRASIRAYQRSILNDWSNIAVIRDSQRERVVQEDINELGVLLSERVASLVEQNLRNASGYDYDVFSSGSVPIPIGKGHSDTLVGFAGRVYTEGIGICRQKIQIIRTSENIRASGAEGEHKTARTMILCGLEGEDVEYPIPLPVLQFVITDKEDIFRAHSGYVIEKGRITKLPDSEKGVSGEEAQQLLSLLPQTVFINLKQQESVQEWLPRIEARDSLARITRDAESHDHGSFTIEAEKSHRKPRKRKPEKETPVDHGQQPAAGDDFQVIFDRKLQEYGI